MPESLNQCWKDEEKNSISIFGLFISAYALMQVNYWSLVLFISSIKLKAIFRKNISNFFWQGFWQYCKYLFLCRRMNTFEQCLKQRCTLKIRRTLHKNLCYKQLCYWDKQMTLFIAMLLPKYQCGEWNDNHLKPFP